MAKTNHTVYAILGLLSTGPKSGYDIKREAETRINHFWKESFGHIYPILKRLYDEGLVNRHTEIQETAPNKQVYSITPAGVEVLHEWLHQPVEPTITRNELLLKLYFGEQIPVEVSKQHIAEYRESHEHILADYEMRREYLKDDTYRLITLLAGIHYCQAVIAWCDEALAKLSEEQS